MNPECSQPHAGWLGRALAEGLSAVPETERRALQGCPMCSTDLKELGALQGLVHGAAQAESEDLAQAAREAGEREEALVRSIYEERIAARWSTERPWWSRPSVIALAAAVALALSLVFVLSRRPASKAVDERPGTFLGFDHPAAGTPVHPIGVVVAFDRIEWTAGTEPVLSWDLHVRSIEGNTLKRLRQSHGTRIELSEHETSEWPNAIEWTLTPRDTSGRLVPEAVITVRAERSSD